MKLLSIIIPSYNSEAYLASCLDSLLIGADDKLEVIVVNDGSKDKTSEIAHSYSDKYDFIKVIDKENGGHGSAINIGIQVATGLFFKVLDSDDHLDTEGLLHLLDMIELHRNNRNLPDLYLADYTSVCITDGATHPNSLSKRFKRIDETLGWNEVRKFQPADYIMIHMTFVKTSVLKEYSVQMVEKTFYEDNQFVYNALITCRTVCYLSKPIYLYSIGRGDQSVSIEKMAKNYEHQLRVMYACLDMLDYETLHRIERYQKRIVFHELFIITYLTYIYCYLRVNKQKKLAYKEFLKQFREKDKKLFRKMYYRSPFVVSWMIPSALRGPVINKSYELLSIKLGWRF